MILRKNDPKNPVKIKELLKKLVTTHTSPHEISLGVAIGVLIGCTPLYGLHTLLFLAFAFLIRPANKIAMFLGTNVSLPPTLPIISWLGYSIGRTVLPGDYPPISWSMLKDLSLKDFLSLYYPLLVGSLILGAIAGVIFYVITYGLIIFHRAQNKRTCRAQ